MQVLARAVRESDSGGAREGAGDRRYCDPDISWYPGPGKLKGRQSARFGELPNGICSVATCRVSKRVRRSENDWKACRQEMRHIGRRGSKADGDLELNRRLKQTI